MRGLYSLALTGKRPDMTDKKANKRPKGAANHRAAFPRQQGTQANQTRQLARFYALIAPHQSMKRSSKAQKGRVNLPPAKAVEMAGQLYSRNQYAQAERVCRQIIAARPANADAHNILGVALAALGQTDQAVESLKARDQNQRAGAELTMQTWGRSFGKLENSTRQRPHSSRP